MKTWCRAGVLLVIAAALQGCRSAGPISSFDDLGPDANTKGFGRLYPQNPEEQEFVVGPGDSIAVSVEQEPTLSVQQVVRPDGKITLPDPEIPDILVGGLTPRQIADKITLMLATILTEASVTVRAVQIASKKIFLVSQGQLGENLVATRPFLGDTTLFDVIASLGGTGPFGDDCHVKVIRGDPRHPRVYTINVREMFMLGFTGGNIQMRPDDIVYVPPSLYGQFAQIMKRISVPLEGFFQISRGISAYERTKRIIEGDNFGVGYGFY